MVLIDWIMIAFWVIGTSLFGIYFRKYIKSTRDYLLAGRKLRWWQIAIAQSADAVDATDFIATTGQGYRTGFAHFGYAWWGMGIGTILLSRYIAPLLYRTGVYTNAEYLELRFNAPLRIMSAAVQVLYRFVAMALVVYAMATMFHVIIGFNLWYGVWIAMGLTLLYVFTSGQLGVVMAAIPQMLLMLVTSVIIFVSAYIEIGGLQGFMEHTSDFGNLLHLSGYSKSGVPGGIYVWGMILTLATYPIVNQTVAQRIVGARSDIDARKGSISSLLPWCTITGVSIIVGIMGIVLLPELRSENADSIFPLYMMQYLSPGLLGLGMAALLLASMSTGAGIGTAIAGMMTMDIFKRFSRSSKQDEFYLRLTRIFAALSIILGTFFAMGIPRFGGMIPFYVAFTGTFFLPLTVPYVGGALYRKASRGSGMAALLGGMGFGSFLFFGSEFLPIWLGHPQWRPFWVLGFSWIFFFTWSIFENKRKGPIPETELASVLNAMNLGRNGTQEEMKEMIESLPVPPWEGQKNIDYNRLGIRTDLPWYSNPTTFELSILILLTMLMVWWW